MQNDHTEERLDLPRFGTTTLATGTHQAVARTMAMMSDVGVPAIFEATFEYDCIRIRADVLERLGTEPGASGAGVA
jgi:hypothetical protein